MSADDVAVGKSWDALAPWWKEAFTDGADVEYEQQIMPIIDEQLRGARRILDLGCGEGQISRRVARYEDTTSVVGIDPSSGQLANTLLPPVRAVSQSPVSGSRTTAPVAYVRGMGERLPFAPASFDAIVCCLAIEHADDVDVVLGEVARVLEPGGRFVLLVNHPMYQGEGSGFVDDQILNERYWRVGPYLDEAVSVEEVDKGVFIPFAHRPLSRYINPLGAVDLVLVSMLEPAPLAAFLEQSIAPDLERAIPRLLVMRFEHRPPTKAPTRRGGSRRPARRKG